IVMLPFTGSAGLGPAPLLRILPALAGASANGAKGVLVTSHIKDFDRLIQLIVSNMSQAKGMSVPRIELFVDETVVMPMAQLLLAPEDAIVRMARSSRTESIYGMPVQDREQQVNWLQVMRRQILLAATPVLLMLVYEAMRGTVALEQLGWAGVLLVLGMAELPFVGKLSQAVGDVSVGSGQLKRSVL